MLIISPALIGFFISPRPQQQHTQFTWETLPKATLRTTKIKKTRQWGANHGLCHFLIVLVLIRDFQTCCSPCAQLAPQTLWNDEDGIDNSQDSFSRFFLIQNIPSGNYSKHFPVNEWFGEKTVSLFQTILELVLMSWSWSHSEKLLMRVQIPPTVKSPLISPLCGDISCGGFVCLFISPLAESKF